MEGGQVAGKEVFMANIVLKNGSEMDPFKQGDVIVESSKDIQAA